MRKYFVIFQTSLLTKLQYMGNLMGRVILYALIVFMLARLWVYMYGSENSLSGYTIEQMIWYVVVTEMIWFSTRSGFIRTEIANDIKSGKIAYTLNKPYNYIFYVLSKYLGETVVGFGFNILVALLIGLAVSGPLQSFSLLYAPFILLTLILSTIVSALIYLLIALVSFWFEENMPFIWIYEKFVLILGIIFPIEIFPKSIQPIIKISPIYTSIYAPAKMTVDFTFPAWVQITLMQGAYLLVVLLLVTVVFSKGVKRLNVNGG